MHPDAGGEISRHFERLPQCQGKRVSTKKLINNKFNEKAKAQCCETLIFLLFLPVLSGQDDTNPRHQQVSAAGQQEEAAAR